LSRRTRLSRPAKSDLIEIWTYVAEGSPQAADRLIDRIRSRCDVLARLPQMGRLRPELAEGIRSFPVGRYLILYRERRGGIEVARVRGGEMDLSRLFEA
jgi:plasmid stabilization system protein ParE